MSTQLREHTRNWKNGGWPTQELATLNRIAEVASRSLNLEEIMQAALDETLQALKMELGVAFNLEKHSQHLRLIAGRNRPPDFPI